MAMTNMSIRVDKDIKEQADGIFAQLGITTTAAINLFLRTAIREGGIPFPLKLNSPNKVTAAAVREGRAMAADPGAAGYHSIEDLKAALEV